MYTYIYILYTYTSIYIYIYTIYIYIYILCIILYTCILYIYTWWHLKFILGYPGILQPSQLVALCYPSGPVPGRKPDGNPGNTIRRCFVNRDSKVQKCSKPDLSMSFHDIYRLLKNEIPNFHDSWSSWLNLFRGLDDVLIFHITQINWVYIVIFNR